MIGRITPALLAAILALAAPVLAQEHELRGIVISGYTGEPLPGVTVELPAHDRVRVTDEEGRFSFGEVPAGHWDVVFYQLGYLTTSHRVDLQARTIVEIELSPDPITLPGIEASVDRLEVRRATAPYSVQAYSQRELRMTSSFDALEFITRRSPGLSQRFARGLNCHLLAPGGSRCRGGAGRLGVLGLTRSTGPIVYIDERRAVFGISQLEVYRPDDFHLIEVYGGGRIIRAYTPHFIERMARGEARMLRPVTGMGL